MTMATTSLILLSIKLLHPTLKPDSTSISISADAFAPTSSSTFDFTCPLPVLTFPLPSLPLRRDAILRVRFSQSRKMQVDPFPTQTPFPTHSLHFSRAGPLHKSIPGGHYFSHFLHFKDHCRLLLMRSSLFTQSCYSVPTPPKFVAP